MVFPIPKGAVGDDASSLGAITINKLRSTIRLEAGEDDTLSASVTGSESFDTTNTVSYTHLTLPTNREV